MMRRLLLSLSFLTAFATIGCAAEDSSSDSVMGRWRAETKTANYWMSLGESGDARLALVQHSHRGGYLDCSWTASTPPGDLAEIRWELFVDADDEAGPGCDPPQIACVALDGEIVCDMTREYWSRDTHDLKDEGRYTTDAEVLEFARAYERGPF